MSRTLDLTEEEQPTLATISTPSILSVPTQTSEPLPAPEATPQAVDLNNRELGLNKNMIGLVLIVIVVLFILVVTLPRRKVTDTFITGDPQKQIKPIAKDKNL